MNAVMPEVTDADGSIGAKTLLPFQVPSLILRRVCPLSGVTDSRGEKAWIRCLDLSQSFARGKAVGKCSVRSRRIFKEAGRFIGRKVVSDNCVGVEKWRVTGKRIQDETRHRVIENAHATPEHDVVRDPKGLPSKAESWRP